MDDDNAGTVWPEVVGASEIEHMLGVSQPRTFQLINRADFPTPWVELRAGKIWRIGDIEAWARAHGRTLTPLPAPWPPPRGTRARTRNARSQ